MAKYKIVSRVGKCDWEEWNPETHQMKKCLADSNIKRGNKFVCKEHLDYYTLFMDSNLEFSGKNGAFISTKKLFLLAAGVS